jgi:hypothetical protein
MVPGDRTSDVLLLQQLSSDERVAAVAAREETAAARARQVQLDAELATVVADRAALRAQLRGGTAAAGTAIDALAPLCGRVPCDENELEALHLARGWVCYAPTSSPCQGTYM